MKIIITARFARPKSTIPARRPTQKIFINIRYIYKDINKRIEEKIEIIEKNLKDIGELKWNYHSFSNNYIFKPSTPVNFNHRNALFKARKLLCDYLNII